MGNEENKRLALVNSEDIRMIADNCKEIKSILSSSLDSHEYSKPIPDSCEEMKMICNDMSNLLWMIVLLFVVHLIVMVLLGLYTLYFLHDFCG